MHGLVLVPCNSDRLLSFFVVTREAADIGAVHSSLKCINSCRYDPHSSGLDSFNAQNIITALRALALNGRTVIATVHQPRSNIYHMFDKLLLLSLGKAMYFGLAKDATTYFSSVGYKCPTNFNPADFVIDLTTPDYRSPELTQASSTYDNPPD